MDAARERRDQRAQVPVAAAAPDGRPGRDVTHEQNRRVRHVREPNRHREAEEVAALPGQHTYVVLIRFDKFYRSFIGLMTVALPITRALRWSSSL